MRMNIRFSFRVCGCTVEAMATGDTAGTIGRPRAHRSAVLQIAGSAACTSASGAFVKLADVNAGTAAFLRCALALIVLVPMAASERRRYGPRPARLYLVDAGAGVLLGADFGSSAPGPSRPTDFTSGEPQSPRSAWISWVG